MAHKYSVKSFIPRNTTCQRTMFKIQKDGKPYGNAEFGNYQEALKVVAFHQLKDFLKDQAYFTLCFNDMELRQSIVLL